MGNQLAKKKAAELMLAELKKAYPNGITTSTSENGSGDGHRLRPKTKSTTVRKKPRNLVKACPFICFHFVRFQQ